MPISLAPLYRAVALIAPRVPPSLGYRACEAAGAAVAGPWLPAYHAIRANLRVVIPEADDAQRSVMARRVIQGILKNYFDLFRYHTLSQAALLATTVAHGVGNIERALAQGRGLLVVAPHIGSYTIVFAPMIRHFNTRALLVVERMVDPTIHAIVNRVRALPGVDVEPLGPNAGRAVLRALRRNHIVVLGGDRAISENTIPVRFFGRATPLPSGPATLALRTGAPLLTGFSPRLPDDRTLAIFDPPLVIDRSDCSQAAVRDVTQKIAYSMEAYIRRDPSQWLVAERVWPDA